MKTIQPGVMSAFLTPFNEDGSVKESAIREEVDFQLARGLDGLYVCGSTGEGMLMNAEERMQVAESAVQAAAGRSQVVVHVGVPDEGTAIALAKHAEQIGAQGLSAVPPYYYKHHKEYVISYYRNIAASTELPFLIYFIPSLVVGLDFSMLHELMKEPHIVGMKWTEDNLEPLYNFKEKHPDKLAFMGHDAMMLCALLLGANGGIGAFYNVMPAGFSRVYHSFMQGDLQAALEEQRQIDHFIAVIKKYMLSANQVPLKAVMKALGVDVGVPRRPIPPIAREAEEAMIRELRNDGFFSLYA